MTREGILKSAAESIAQIPPKETLVLQQEFHRHSLPSSLHHLQVLHRRLTHSVEQALDVPALLCADEVDYRSQAVRVLHCGLEAHFLLLEEVGLVADDGDDGVWRTVGLQLVDPALHYFEGVRGCDVEDADGDPRSLVVEGRDRPVLLLSSCVPNMELDGLSSGQGMELGQVGSSERGLSEGTELLIMEGFDDR